MSETIEARTVSPNEAKKAVGYALTLKRPIMIWGAPGIGKSDIVKQIGNYEEIYEKYLGTETPLNLKRGYNKLYTEGGLLYAPPLR